MEENLNILSNKYLLYNLTTIRNRESGKAEIIDSLINLGSEIGKFILNNYCLTETTVETPMSKKAKGFEMLQAINVIVSTRNDYENFNKGCRNLLRNSLYGFIDFGNARGEEVYRSSINAINLPQVPYGKRVHNLIILKSILATGCTAIALTRRSLELYRPINLIIGSIFYSKGGVSDILLEFPNVKIIVVGDSDSINSEGMLLPGIGDLDYRISG